MNAIASYRYDPSWRLVALMAMCAGIFVVGSLLGYLPLLMGLIGGLLFIGMGVMMAARRLAFSRSLVIDADGLWLPTGFMRMFVRRLNFADVTDVWETSLPFSIVVLCLKCQGKTREVLSCFLPDRETYEAIGRHVVSRLEAIHG